MKCKHCRDPYAVFIVTNDYASVCSNCGCVEKTLYVRAQDCEEYFYQSTYKYEAHWNEHIKTLLCEDPPIPYDIHIFIRLAIYENALRRLRFPETKQDIKKILSLVEIPEEIQEKYVVNRKFSIHRKYYERWRTIIQELGVTKVFLMSPAVRWHLTEMFKVFVVSFTRLQKDLGRKSLFHFDFMIYHFLYHLFSIDIISEYELQSIRAWIPIRLPKNEKTYSEFKTVCRLCHFTID